MQEGCRGRFTSCLRMTLETGWERLPAERLRTQDAAGRVAYRDIAAGHDFPPYNRSAVDGYAIRTHGRGTSGSEELEVGLSLSAAQVHQVVSAECIEVSTGTPLPEGFDLVVKKEDATLSGRKVLPGRHMPWENVAVRGEDLRAGTVIVRAGEVLRPESIGALLSCGVREVEAFSRIRVGVVSTGDELLEGLIENSTQPEIVSFFSSRFTEVEAIGPVRDRPSEIYEAVLGSVERNNITVVTGGSSVGEHDHSRVSVSSMGEEVFSGIGLKPGRTLSLYRVKGRPVFVISGLPGAAIVSLRPFVAFLLQALMKSKPRVLHVDRLAGLQIGPDEAWAVPLDLAWSGQGIAMMPMHNRGTHRLSLVSRAMWTLYVDGSCSDAFLMEAGGIDRTIV